MKLDSAITKLDGELQGVDFDVTGGAAVRVKTKFGPVTLVYSAEELTKLQRPSLIPGSPKVRPFGT